MPDSEDLPVRRRPWPVRPKDRWSWDRKRDRKAESIEVEGHEVKGDDDAD